jgi:hypothetical protein
MLTLYIEAQFPPPLLLACTNEFMTSVPQKRNYNIKTLTIGKRKAGHEINASFKLLINMSFHFEQLNVLFIYLFIYLLLSELIICAEIDTYTFMNNSLAFVLL